MSQYIVEQENKKFVFGWDQPLQSFYLQVHNLTLPEDEQIIDWLGADEHTRMYEGETLARAADKHGLVLTYSTLALLYEDKDEGR